jgi:hypothetical protein
MLEAANIAASSYLDARPTSLYLSLATFLPVFRMYAAAAKEQMSAIKATVSETNLSIELAIARSRR